MTNSRLCGALIGIGLALTLIVVTSLFGSSFIVRYLTEVDAKNLAYEWVEELGEEFDLPGEPYDPYYGPFEYAAALFLDVLDEDASLATLAEPSVFEKNRHSGQITGYAINNRFGMRLIGGGARLYSEIFETDLEPIFVSVLESKQTAMFKTSATGGRDELVNILMIPLVRDGRSNGVAQVEVTRFGNTLFLERGVQIVSGLIALTIAIVGAVAILMIYSWGRMAHRATQQADFLASTDTVTLLPNRRKFEEVLPLELAAALKSKSEIVVIFCDVDNFKSVNDTYGHTTGDKLLVAIGDRLKDLMPNPEHLFRVSGDHFAILIETPGGTPEIKTFCEKIQETMRPEFLPEIPGLKTTLSSGVARFPQDGRDKEQLMKAADLALHSAKRAGRSTYRLFTPRMNSDSVDAVKLQHALENALQNDGLQLVYQPQVKAGCGSLVGFEALARWTHPTEGPISPMRFISVAEKSGLIGQLGEWALRTACDEARFWPEHMSIAVNLSPLQLRDARLPGLVSEVLRTTGITPERLELEVTESVMMHESELSQQTFEALDRLGIGLALDDFGTGFSSLNYLTRIPLTKMKIDKSFVDRFGKTERDDAILFGLVQLGRNLGLKITAEGVETLTQAVGLSKAGCTSLQGYYFGRPMSDPRELIKQAQKSGPTEMLKIA